MKELLKPKLILLFMISMLGLGILSYCAKPRTGEFQASVLMLGLNFTAKALCSCVFVSEQSEEQCLEYASIEQVSPKLKVDRGEKTASSSFLFWQAQARYEGPERGCVLL